MDELLSDFCSSKNADVQTFLTDPNKAIRLERTSKSRTYLILDDNSGQILAYFSLSIKEVSLNQDNEQKPSKTLVKRLDGICKKTERVNAYLIGQIGKNDSVADNQINLSYILEEAYTIIEKANQLVGGRVIILECEKAEKLVELYKNNGYNILIDNPAERLITMYICVADSIKEEE